MNDAKKRRLAVVLRILQAGVVAGVCVVFWLYKTTPAPAPVAPPAESAAPKAPAAAAEPMVAAAPRAPSMEKDWGIRVLKLALTRQGSAIDLRYQIVDPGKVGLLADATNVAYLVDQASGTEIHLSASARQQAWRRTTRVESRALSLRLAGEFPPPAGRILAGKTYSALLQNPSGIVKAGNKMAFVIGQTRLHDLVVE